MNSKSLVIISDQQFLSDLLEKFIKGYGFKSVRTFPNPKDGLSYSFANSPDVIIMDMILPRKTGRLTRDKQDQYTEIPFDSQLTLRMIRDIRSKCPNSRIIILNGNSHPNTYLAGFAAGADGIVNTHEPLESFLRIFTKVVAGESSVVSQATRKSLLESQRLPTPSLSNQEIYILELIQEGMNNSQIAEKFNYSDKTVRNKLTIIYKKLGMPNRSQAVRTAIEFGLLGQMGRK